MVCDNPTFRALCNQHCPVEQGRFLEDRSEKSMFSRGLSPEEAIKYRKLDIVFDRMRVFYLKGKDI